ncbi:MAG: hypothetical protein B7Z80_20445, partial [Rhodospirillales bacterium 20-64-7]
MDITYMPKARGFVCLAAVVDGFSRRVLAWRVSITIEAEFCLEALGECQRSCRLVFVTILLILRLEPSVPRCSLRGRS